MTMLETSERDWSRVDADSILHPATNADVLAQDGARIIESGTGIYLTDSDGHELIDGVAGLWCVNAGYGRAELADAMQRAAMNLGYYHSFAGMSNLPQIQLAERLLQIGPAGMSKVFFGSGGSDANDTVVKLTRYINNVRGKPEKKKIISRWQAYHGTSLVTAGLTGLPTFHKDFDLPLPGTLHTGSPDYFRYGEEGESEEAFTARRVAELEAMIQEEGPDTIAAMIAEPVLGAGGVVPPPAGYLKGIEAVLKRHDILMVIDEVVCGYGRLGSWFGSQHFDIQPDIVTSAKALTSGYFPMSATFISDEVWEFIREGSRKHGNFAHGYTYAGHPVGAAVALANLDLIEQEGLVANAATVGAYFHQRLEERLGSHPNVGEIRGEGLLQAVQLVEDRATRKTFTPGRAKAVSQQAYHEGLIVRPLPTVDALAFSPPLILRTEDVDTIVDRLEAAITKTLTP
jgi:L-2,4-diaminobutyrate transaminase